MNESVPPSLETPRAHLSGSGLRFATQGDAVPGGYNGSIFLLTEEGAQVGRLDYQTCTDSRWDDGAVEIAFVIVAPERRRQGWGSTLVRRLKEEFPDRCIRWGYTTEEGEALRLAVEHMGPAEPRPLPSVFAHVPNSRRVRRSQPRALS